MVRYCTVGLLTVRMCSVDYEDNFWTLNLCKDYFYRVKIGSDSDCRDMICREKQEKELLL